MGIRKLVDGLSDAAVFFFDSNRAQFPRELSNPFSQIIRLSDFVSNIKKGQNDNSLLEVIAQYELVKAKYNLELARRDTSLFDVYQQEIENIDPKDTLSEYFHQKVRLMTKTEKIIKNWETDGRSTNPDEAQLVANVMANIVKFSQYDVNINPDDLIEISTKAPKIFLKA